MNISTIGGVLETLMKRDGVNDNELSRLSGVPQPTVTRIRNGTTQHPNEATVQALANHFGLSKAQMRGEQAIPQMARTSERALYNVEPAPDIRGGKVPVVSWVAAGDWTTVEDPYALGGAEEWIDCPVKHGPRTFVLRVRGMSMYNPNADRSFRPGELIFVDPDRGAVHTNFVVARTVDSKEATFKQYIEEENGRYLMALNPSWPDRIIRFTEDTVLVGVVIFKGESL